MICEGWPHIVHSGTTKWRDICDLPCMRSVHNGDRWLNSCGL
eukprot:COSAG02_NODE_66204_length_256_cov_0.649682_1_plen_41_part_10